LIDNLCAAFAGGSADPTDQNVAEVVLAGISSVAINRPDDPALRSALVAVAKRALPTPMKD
jgi:hypothetical protein